MMKIQSQMITAEKARAVSTDYDTLFSDHLNKVNNNIAVVSSHGWRTYSALRDDVYTADECWEVVYQMWRDLGYRVEVDERGYSLYW